VVTVVLRDTKTLDLVKMIGKSLLVDSGKIVDCVLEDVGLFSEVEKSTCVVVGALDDVTIGDDVVDAVVVEVLVVVDGDEVDDDVDVVDVAVVDDVSCAVDGVCVVDCVVGSDDDDVVVGGDVVSVTLGKHRPNKDVTSPRLLLAHMRPAVHGHSNTDWRVLH